MCAQIHQMTPLLPEGAEELQDIALEVIQNSAALGNRQDPVTLNALREFLRIINSYYSNLIEGHNTHPYDIVRAMQREYDSEPAKRNLQNEGPIKFCRFFLEVCLDQVEYMEGLLRLEALVERIRRYVELRGYGMIPSPIGKKVLKTESARMLQEVLVQGEAARGMVIAASGLKERTGRSLLGQLLDEGLLVSDTPKGEVRLGFPIHAAGWFFPDLYPSLSH